MPVLGNDCGIIGLNFLYSAKLADKKDTDTKKFVNNSSRKI